MEDNTTNNNNSKPHEMHIFIPPYPCSLPSLPLRPYQTNRLRDGEHQETFLSPFIPRMRGRREKNINIEPPFPWATCKRATVHSLEYLLSHNLTTIRGLVKCRNCHAQREIEFDLVEKLKEVGDLILEYKKEENRKKRIDDWLMNKLDCDVCRYINCMKAVICEKKRGINWLFLLLGKMIDCCTVVQLKYFCKHALDRRNVSNDRLMYYTYLGICKQLLPQGPFDPPRW